MSDLQVCDDEMVPLRRAIDLDGRDVLDLGCGGGGFARRILAETSAASVTGVDTGDLSANKPGQGVRFLTGEAQALPFGDHGLDVVVMMKSLHHVPIDAMDAAFDELSRVLRKNGQVYICEPAYAGDFNDILKIFHDEGIERAAARRALERAQSRSLFRLEGRHDYIRPVRFENLDQFRRNLMHLPWLKSRITPEVEQQVAQKYSESAKPDGSASFTSHMLVFALTCSR